MNGAALEGKAVAPGVHRTVELEGDDVDGETEGGGRG